MKADRSILLFKFITVLVASIFLVLPSGHTAWLDVSNQDALLYARMLSAKHGIVEDGPYWENYFKSLNNVDEDRISSEIEKQVLVMLDHISNRPEQAHKVLALWHSLRRYMPDEFRWVLAALEVHAGKVNQSTLVDLESIASRASFGPRKIRMMGVKVMFGSSYVIDCPPKQGEKRTRYELIFNSITAASFLMNSWHQVAKLFPESNTVKMQVYRKNWLGDVADASSSFKINQLDEIFKGLDNVEGTRFQNEADKHEFLEHAVLIARRQSHHYGKYKINPDGDIVYSHAENVQNPYFRIRKTISRWIYGDVIYLVKNLTGLQKSGLVTFTQSMELDLSPSQLQILKDRVVNKKLDSAAYVSGVLILLNQKDNNSISPELRKDLVSALHQTMIESATEKYGLVDISAKGSTTVRAENGFYYAALNQYFKYILKNGGLSVEQSKDLFNRSTIKTAYLEKSEFEKLEAIRLHVVGKSLSYDDYKSEMFQRIAQGTQYSDEEQMRVANHLENFLTDADRIEASAVIKKRFTNKTWVGLFKPVMDWDAKSGWPVELMLKVHPKDPELLDHLLSIILEKKTQTAISEGDALTHLIKLKVGSAGLKKYLLRQLSSSSPGDTVNYFYGLIRLYPDAPAEILQALFRFQKEEDKLIEMLKLLVMEAIENPTVLKNIEDHILNNRNTIEAGRFYRNENVADFLKSQIKRNKSVQCRKFYLGSN